MRGGPLFLGFDVGTGGTKALAIDPAEGRVVARGASSYDLLPPSEPGEAEQHPHTWIRALEEVAAELRAKIDPARVAALGVSGQQHGAVLLDGEGEVLRPAKLWCDTTTAEEARELSAHFGRPVPSGFTAPKLLWSRRHEPELFRRVRTVLLPHDYVNFRLTGRRVTEAGDASGTGLFDPLRRSFNREEAAWIDPRLPDCLPELVEPGEPAGRLSAAGAALLGLTEGLWVSAGGGDNMMSAVGSGATREGVVVVSLGTSGTVFTHRESPLVDPSGLVAPFCASIGGWLPLVCIMNLTGPAEEVARAFGQGHGELTEAARQVPPGCDGLLWLPYLMGERVPDLPQARGTLEGMAPGHLAPGVLYRAALEGTSLNLAWGVDRLRALGVAVEGVHVVGGAAGNPLWREILSAALACPLTPLAEAQSAALGAALQALWTWKRGRGEDADLHSLCAPFLAPAAPPTHPQPERVALYAELGRRFRARAAALYGA